MPYGAAVGIVHSEKMATSQRSGASLAAVSALASFIAAGSCCLPLGPVLIAAGFAGLSALLETLRPWLIGCSVVSLSAGFWLAYGRKRCDTRPGRVSVALLWSALAITLVMMLFPGVIAGLVADALEAGRQ